MKTTAQHPPSANGCSGGGGDRQTPSPAPAEVPAHHQPGFQHTHAAPGYHTAQQEYDSYMQQEARTEPIALKLTSRV